MLSQDEIDAYRDEGDTPDARQHSEKARSGGSVLSWWATCLRAALTWVHVCFGLVIRRGDPNRT